MMVPALILLNLGVLVCISNAQRATDCCQELQESCGAQQASVERSTILTKLDAILSRQDDMDTRPVLTRLAACGTPGVIHEYNNRVYMLGLAAATWAQARVRCHRCGLGLARIESQAEQDDIRDWLNEIHAITLGPVHMRHGGMVWMDGTDEGHENCWIWTHPTVTRFSRGYTAYESRQPDNYRSREHCNQLWYRSGRWTWNDDECYATSTFLCKSLPPGQDAMPSLAEVRATNACP